MPDPKKEVQEQPQIQTEVQEQPQPRLHEKLGWDRPQSDFNDLWLNRLPHKTERQQAILEENEDAVVALTPQKRPNVRHLPFVLSEEQSAVLDAAEAQEEKGYIEAAGGLVTAATAGVVEGAAHIGVLPQYLFNPHWRETVEQDENGGYYVRANGVGASDIRKLIIEGDPEGWGQNLAMLGGQLGSGWGALRLAGGIVNTGKGILGYKSATSANSMTASMLPHSKWVDNAVRIGIQETIVEALVMDPLREGSITSIASMASEYSRSLWDGFTPDESAAVVTYIASEGNPSVASSIAENFKQDLLLNIGFAGVIDGVIRGFKTAKSKLTKAEKAILDDVDGIARHAEDELLPAIWKEYQLGQTARGSDAHMEAQAILVDAIGAQEAKRLTLYDKTTVAKNGSSDVDQLTAKLNKADAEGNTAATEIIQAQIKNKHLNNGGKKIKDPIEGTGEPRIKALIEDRAKGSSSNAHAYQELADKLAKMSKENQDEVIRKYVRSLEDGTELAEDNLIAQLMGVNAVRITGDDVLQNFVSDMHMVNNTAADIFKATPEGYKAALAGLKDELGLTQEQVENFVKNAADRPQAILMAHTLRQRTRSAVRDMMEKNVKARNSDDVLDLFAAIHSFNVAMSHSQLARQLGSLDGAGLQAHRWVEETGEALSMKIAAIRAKSDLSKGSVVDTPTAQTVAGAPDIAEAIFKGQISDIDAMRATVVDLFGGPAGVADARKLLDDIAKEGGDLGKLNNMKQRTRWQKVQDAFSGYALNGMLSSPITSAKVVIGGITQSVLIPTTRAIGIASSPLRVFKGKALDMPKIKDEATQLANEAYMLLKGIPEAVGSGLRTAFTRRSSFSDDLLHEFQAGAKTGYTSHAAYRKVKGEWQHSSLAKKALGIGKIGLMGVNDLIKTPTAALMSGADELFKTLNFKASMREGLMKDPKFAADKKLLEAEIDQQVIRQTSELARTSMKKAQAVTLQTPLVGTGKETNITAEGLQRASKEAPLLRVLIPFTKTITNMADESMEFIPLVSKPLRWLSPTAHIGKRLAERMEGPDNIWKKQAVAGKQAMLIPMFVGIYQMMDSGIIQGGGQGDFQARKKLETETPFLPYSILIGNTRYKFSDFIEPIGMPLRFIARLKEATDATVKMAEEGTITYDEASRRIVRLEHKWTDLTSHFIGMVFEEATSLTPALGVSKAVGAFAKEGPQRDSYLASLLAMLTPLPSLEKYLKDNADPEFKISSGWQAALAQRTSWSLAPLYALIESDIPEHGPVAVYDKMTGKPMVNPNAWLQRLGVKTKGGVNPEFDKFMIDNIASLGTMRRTKALDGVTDLSPEDQELWQKIQTNITIDGETLGEAYLKTVKMITDNPDKFPDATTAYTPEAKRNTKAVRLITDVDNKFAKAADALFFRERESLRAAADIKKVQKELIRKGALNQPIIDAKKLRKASAAQIKQATAEMVKQEKQKAPTTSEEAQDLYQP